ncbi:hypothetical protein SteCoe_19672 [Stentor coeruleus]|uniref:G-protein coupled receptors family 2 profile 2 domain-containing protein n=1 Tax=Stentor coeruleus TaxID=5963 RepID=A0A1R2BTW0_9CILI|nr:hypothetical protein SteCoe_19672 [Stentor coeruleus]
MTIVHAYIAVAISSGLSFLGCTFIISVYYKYKQLQGPAYKLISILSIIDIFRCFVFLIPTYGGAGDSPLCICQAIAITIFTLASILWTSVISIFLYITVVKKKIYEKQIPLALGICILISLLASFIPLINDDFDEYAISMGWCWIKNKDLKFFILYFPLWIVVILNTTIYMILIKHIRFESHLHPELHDLGLSVIRKLRMYPVLLIVSFLPAGILRSMQFFGASTSENFLIVAGAFACLNGFFNAIVYGCTQNVRFALTGRNVINSKESLLSNSSKGISFG